MTVATAGGTKGSLFRLLPRTALRGGLLALAIPVAIAGTILQAVGFVAFSAADTLAKKSS